VADKKFPYEDSRAGEGALIETQKILAKFGCESFGTMVDAERGVTIVQFKYRGRTVSMEASWTGYAAALKKARPYNYRMRGTRADYDERLLKKAKVAVCSVLRDWVKSQITAVECGIMSFDAVFMPYMLLSHGKRLVDEADKIMRSKGIELLNYEEES
jgi:hypothetical protein